MNKRQWQRPALIVLVRSRPEESVLAACKALLRTATGPSIYVSGCLDGSPLATICQNLQCDVIAAS